jgi:hypothetical protein
MDDKFMLNVVVPMRLELGFPFTIPRGGAYRCKEYDGKYGAHQGHAIDVIANSRRRFLIIDWLIRRNVMIDLNQIDGEKVTRIGVNNGSIHFDDLQSDKKDVEVMWDYY